MSDGFDPQRRLLITAGLSAERAAAAGAAPAPEPNEAHVSSLVVHALPAAVPSVREAIEAIRGAEVHAVSAHGKMVVTLETATEGDIVTALNEISLLGGVLSVAMVFHHYEPEAAGPAPESPVTEGPVTESQA